jgi:hypothetical protein
MVATAIAYVLGLSASATFLLNIALVAISSAYQIRQAKKLREAARRAADARKGFEFVVEGSIEALPIVYGKALIGGTRVYHNVSSSFIYASPNSDLQLSTGSKGYQGTTYTGVDESGIEYSYTVGATAANLLDKDYSGTKNEFLFFQQAMCQGPINAVYDVIIDRNQFLDDPSLGETYSNVIYRNGTFAKTENSKAAIRFDFHYNGGYDSIVAANFSERKSALFSNVAYLSSVIRLDRDQPQFNSGVPTIQAIIEGRKVKTVNIVNGVYILDSNRTYTNNPAYCLLDYLLDDISGKGIDISQIDLKSFKDSADICETIVQNNVAVGGKFYKPTAINRDISSVNLKLYECNIIIDVTKPVRENIESILSTMGDARLVWSQGKYKLSLQYPATNQNISLAATITDDDLATDTPVQVAWANAGEKFNFCTVRYHNEFENFREDSVSWPSKTNQQFVRGIGGKRYIPVSGWDTIEPYQRFLNNYAVWEGTQTSCTLQWKIIAPETGEYTIQFVAQNNGTLTINSVSVSGGTFGIASNTVTLTANQEYTIIVAGSSGSDTIPRGVAATLRAPSGVYPWTTRSESYSSFTNVTLTNTLYNQYLTEDGNVKLETDVFAEGITNYYHAIAKAEELVRSSRFAVTVKFQYLVKDKYLEPGDFIKLQSNTLKLGDVTDLYLRIEEASIKDGAICEVTATRFDASQQIWSVKSTAEIKPPQLYDFSVNAVPYLTYTPANTTTAGSSGILNWGESSDFGVLTYILYFHESGNFDSDNRPVFTEIGRATRPPFNVPNLKNVSGIFGIRALKGTIISELTVTSSVAVTYVNQSLQSESNASLNVTRYGTYEQAIRLTWTIPGNRVLSNIPYDDHSVTRVYRKLSTETDYVLIGESSGTSYVDYNPIYGILQYRVAFVSSKNLSSDFSNVVSISYSFDDAFAKGQVLSQLAESIGDSQIDSILRSRIDLIDAPGTGLSQKVIDLEQVYGNTTNAATSATVAANSASSAITAAANAIIAKDNAALSASNAIESLQSTLTAKTDALLAKSGADSAKDSAIIAKTEAETAKALASTSASQSSSSATTAEAAASLASQSAGLASASATAANDRATSALNSASSASSYASDAISASGIAQTNRISSESARDAAQTAATSAINSASNALTYADNSSQSAAAAQTNRISAETAKDTAQNFAQSAINNASSASAFSSSAAQSANASLDSAISAGTQAGLANTYAQQSATSASSASGSASIATERAGLAATSANEAAGSASAARISESNASTYATNSEVAAASAASSRVQAKTSEDNASGYASAASSSAQTASIKAGEAGQYASAASESATTATTKASQASVSAGQAATSASNASNSASNAFSYSNTAASASSNASNSATDAANYASNAQGFANAASSSANSASGFSNSASSFADAASTSKTAAQASFVNSVKLNGNFDFSQGKTGWYTDTSFTTETPGTIGTGGVTGNAKLTLAGEAGVYWFRKIPIQTNRSYKVRFRVKSIGTTNSRVYAGVATFDKDGALQETAPGTHRYCATDGVNVPSDGNWKVYEGIITGEGNDSHNQFRVGSVFAAPMFIVNYQQGGSYICEVDECSFEDVTESQRASTSADAAATSASQASTSATNAASSASAASGSSTSAATSSTNATNQASNAATSASNASNSATNAANSASNAATSASNAADSASTAATHASNASTSATQASTSKTDAANSASAASTSASTAASSATNAATSASNAANSATAASNHASNASTYATNASNSATNSENSASNASTSAGTAASSATNAATNATNAATSATNANTSASNAANSATNAENSATAASNHASNASTYATNASNSASNAAGSASAAATSAGGAATSASGASTSATAAFNSASNAATSASAAAGSATAAATSLQQIVATATGFDSGIAWNFDSNLEGFTQGGHSTFSVANSVLTAVSNSNDPIIISPTISLDGSKNYLIRMRIKRIAGTGWQGTVYFTGTGIPNHTESYTKTISDPTVTNEWRVIEWDMSSLTTGTNAWITKTITSIRLDLGSSSADRFEIDWIAIGRIAPQAYTTAIQQKMEVRSYSSGAALANYSVVIDSNGKISGFGLSSETNSESGAQASTFGVRADKFYIANSSNTASTVLPFTVLTTTDANNNPPGVYIDNAMVRSASINTAKIENAAITTLKIGTNQVTVPLVYEKTGGAGNAFCLTYAFDLGVQTGETSKAIFLWQAITDATRNCNWYMYLLNNATDEPVLTPFYRPKAGGGYNYVEPTYNCGITKEGNYSCTLVTAGYYVSAGAGNGTHELVPATPLIGWNRAGQAYQDAPVILGIGDVGPGNNRVFVYWAFGGGSIYTQKLTVLGAKR